MWSTTKSIVDGRRVSHDEIGIRKLCAQLIELDGGLIAVRPNRPPRCARVHYSGAKSDNFGAVVLAELARTDSHRFRVLVRDSDATQALRA